RARLEGAAGRLHALSPLATLARGYAVARDRSGKPLTNAASFTPGLHFQLVLRDGEVPATVDEAVDVRKIPHPPTG
ncbi:MAG TPA: exodeoxyribonuclease VII large subunit, partial [Gemmatimonadaceae bacterium]